MIDILQKEKRFFLLLSRLSAILESYYIILFRFYIVLFFKSEICSRTVSPAAGHQFCTFIVAFDLKNLSDHAFDHMLKQNVLRIKLKCFCCCCCCNYIIYRSAMALFLLHWHAVRQKQN